MNQIIRLSPVALLLLTAACGGGKPETSVNAPAANPSEAPATQPAAPETHAGKAWIPGPASGTARYDSECAARLEGLGEKEDPAQRAAIYVGAITPPPSAAQAACLLAAADDALKHESSRLARAAAALLLASLSPSEQDRQFFIDSQPKNYQEYQPFGLRPDLYEVMQDKLISLASAGSAAAMERLLQSLYFRDARLQDRLLPTLADLANRQGGLFFGALKKLDAAGSGFVLAAMKNRDLTDFRAYLKGRSGADAETAKQYLARLGPAAR
jgi:hypothetical protein